MFTVKEGLDNLGLQVDQILRRHRLSKVPEDTHLAHFTSVESLGKILSAYEDHRELSDYWPQPKLQPIPLSLWRSDVSCLNDPLEGRALFEFVKTASKRRRAKVWGKMMFDDDEWLGLENTISEVFETPAGEPRSRQKPLRRVLIASFTMLAHGEEERLDLWRAYGINAAGVCLSMPLKIAIENLGEATPLYRVEYSELAKATTWRMLWNHLSAIRKAARGSLPAEDPKGKIRPEDQSEIKRLCEKLFHVYKHAQYENEREVRLVHVVDSDEPDRYHKKGVFFGPGLRTDLSLNRVFSYSPPFFMASPDSRIIIGPRAKEADRLASTLEAYFGMLWGDNAPAVRVSTVPYR